MITDSCVSWIVLTIIVIMSCLYLFIHYIEWRERDKTKEIKIKYDQDLFL